MKFLPAFALLVSLAFAVPAIAAPPPNVQCELKTMVTEIHSLGELPPEIRKLLAPMAEIGGQFNKTDVVTNAGLPFKRMIRGGFRRAEQGGTDWFIWYEHGGITYFWHAVVLHLPPEGGEVKVRMNAGTIADNLCTLTDAAFAGRPPQYSQGSWAQTYY